MTKAATPNSLEMLDKYRMEPFLGPDKFRFPNSERNSIEAIRTAFKLHGLVVEDVQRPWICVTVVMDQHARLWEHDTSHGGGGYFTLSGK